MDENKLKVFSFKVLRRIFDALQEQEVIEELRELIII